MADPCQKPPSNVWDFLKEHESSAWAVAVGGTVTCIAVTVSFCVAWYNVERVRAGADHEIPITITVTTKKG